MKPVRFGKDYSLKNYVTNFSTKITKYQSNNDAINLKSAPILEVFSLNASTWMIWTNHVLDSSSALQLLQYSTCSNGVIWQGVILLPEFGFNG